MAIVLVVIFYCNSYYSRVVVALESGSSSCSWCSSCIILSKSLWSSLQFWYQHLSGYSIQLCCISHIIQTWVWGIHLWESFHCPSNDFFISVQPISLSLQEVSSCTEAHMAISSPFTGSQRIVLISFALASGSVTFWMTADVKVCYGADIGWDNNLYLGRLQRSSCSPWQKINANKHNSMERLWNLKVKDINNQILWILGIEVNLESMRNNFKRANENVC